MGIIKAAVSSVKGALADSWLETIEPDSMSGTAVMVSGVTVRKGKSQNVKGADNLVSNGSVIHVYPNMAMLLVDNGKVVDFCAEEGYYEVSLSSAPSLFNGQLAETVKDTWQRFKFGGVPSSKQKVYYINLQEIKGIKFGTVNPINYWDDKYNAELFLRAHGSFSVKITDPLKFFNEAVPRDASRCDFNQIREQYMQEFLDALQSSINRLSADGVQISYVTSKSRELSRYMKDALDEDWNNLRGIEVGEVGLGSISYDEKSRQYIDKRNEHAMFVDPSMREAYVQTAVADGIKAAGSNAGGASHGFLGVGMAMQGSAGFMASATQTNTQQMQARQAAQQPANTWQCSCGQSVSGNFCNNCGNKKPDAAGTWQCSCGQSVSGNFCNNCGNKKPEAAGAWQCSCGQSVTGNFCNNCGNKKA